MDKNDEIRALREQGCTIREISQKTGEFGIIKGDHFKEKRQ